MPNTLSQRSNRLAPWLMIVLRQACQVACIASLVGIPPTSSPVFAQPEQGLNLTGQRIVKDPFTGVAMNGIDPLSYFLQRNPVPGRADVEVYLGGAIWWFQNTGNRAAFLEAPHIYIPAFGGHGAMSLARGYLTEGQPSLWLLREARVLLFYSAGNRLAFLQNPELHLERARENWEQLSQDLIP